MKTIVEFKDGRLEEHLDVAPDFDMEGMEISFVDDNMGIDPTDTISIELVKRIVFES